MLTIQQSIAKFFIGNLNSESETSHIKLRSKFAIPNTIQPFTSMDETTRILDDEYHPLDTDNKVVLDMNLCNPNQVKIDLDWLFEVENVELDGYVLIDNPVVNINSENNEMLVLASLKVDNNQYTITIYDANGVLVECSFAIDC